MGAGEEDVRYFRGLSGGWVVRHSAAQVFAGGEAETRVSSRATGRGAGGSGAGRGMENAGRIGRGFWGTGGG